MTVAIIDYGSGNLHSAQKAFERAGNSCGAKAPIIVTSDPDKVRAADRIVLPGVGAFGDCKAGLVAATGVLEALEEAVLRKGRPFLGICVGMQLLAEEGLEHGNYLGLGWIKGQVQAIEPADPSFKVPHMGWNTIDEKRSHALLANIPIGASGLHAYFVHSYQLVPDLAETVIATAEYGGPIVAAVGRDNIVGTQFHPEKSQKLGLALIENVLRWTP